MSLYNEIVKVLQWPYIRHNESETLHNALIIMQNNGAIPKKMSKDVEFILEKYNG